MIIWSGFGISVPILVFLSALLASLFHEDTTLGNAGYMASTLLISFLPVLLIGFGMDGASKEGEADEEPGAVHSFFFIKIKYWGFILLAGGLYMLVKVLF